jgi:altronate dehydratase
MDNVNQLRTAAAPGPHVFRVHPEDNVAVTASPLCAGQRALFEGRELRASDDVPMGHKIAVARIAAGEKVIKYGGPIGSATRDILPGEHVHTHNLKSDYLPTGGYSTFRG